MIDKLVSKEEVNAALVLVLSGTVMALVANGPGPVSFRRVVAGVLSNPVPRGAVGTDHYSSGPASPQRVAA